MHLQFTLCLCYYFASPASACWPPEERPEKAEQTRMLVRVLSETITVF